MLNFPEQLEGAKNASHSLFLSTMEEFQFCILKEMCYTGALGDARCHACLIDSSAPVTDQYILIIMFLHCFKDEKHYVYPWLKLLHNVILIPQHVKQPTEAFRSIPLLQYHEEKIILKNNTNVNAIFSLFSSFWTNPELLKLYILGSFLNIGE